jgi:hypothetical protein
MICALFSHVLTCAVEFSRELLNGTSNMLTPLKTASVGGESTF